MRKRICYIHVWPHKTGTTSIQWFLQENRADLLKHGYFLPESETKRNEKIADSYFVSCLVSGFLKQRADFLVRLQYWRASIPVRQVKRFRPGEKILNVERRDSYHRDGTSCDSLSLFQSSYLH